MENNHISASLIRAERVLKVTLALLNLPVRGSYSNKEVCGILGIGPATFWRLIRAYGRDGNGRLLRPESLDSFILSNHRRVNYVELLDFLKRNNGLEREVMQNTADSQKPIEPGRVGQ